MPHFAEACSFAVPSLKDLQQRFPLVVVGRIVADRGQTVEVHVERLLQDTDHVQPQQISVANKHYIVTDSDCSGHEAFGRFSMNKPICSH